MSRLFHLAGIVPCVDQRKKLLMPWDDYLYPIGWNLLAVERAVLECAYIGCETIWIVLDKRTQPLIKERMGESVLDPLFYNLYRKRFPEKHRKEIPIYYVPIHPRDAYQRDSQIWSTIYGSRVADKVSRQMSSWLAPHKFYVANPYALYPYSSVIKVRREASSKTKRLVLTTPDGKDFTDGLYTGFSYNFEDVKEWYKIFRSQEIRQYDPDTYRGTYDRSKAKRLPIEKRYSGRRMSLKDVYGKFNPNNNCDEIVEHEIEYYYDLREHRNYEKFIRETEGLKTFGALFKNRRFTRIGQEGVEDSI